VKYQCRCNDHNKFKNFISSPTDSTNFWVLVDRREYYFKRNRRHFNTIRWHDVSRCVKQIIWQQNVVKRSFDSNCEFFGFQKLSRTRRYNSDILRSYSGYIIMFWRSHRRIGNIYWHLRQSHTFCIVRRGDMCACGGDIGCGGGGVGGM